MFEIYLILKKAEKFTLEKVNLPKCLYHLQIKHKFISRLTTDIILYRLFIGSITAGQQTTIHIVRALIRFQFDKFLRKHYFHRKLSLLFSLLSPINLSLPLLSSVFLSLVT